MTTAAPILHSLEILEKEFEKAYVDLDVLVTDYENFEFCDDHIETVQTLMKTMSLCFSQLCHKTQMTAISNAKLEAVLLDTKENLLDARSKHSASEAKLMKIIKQPEKQENISDGQKTSDSKEKTSDLPENDLQSSNNTMFNEARLKVELSMLKEENDNFKTTLQQVESELFGARLASKYLDKELAGRMQQIQLLSTEKKPPNFDRLWDQLESEISLNRQKIIVKACRKQQSMLQTNDPKISSEVRTVLISKKADESLGISITGGKDQGLPILVSEIHSGGFISRNKNLLYVGDILKSINGEDLQCASHSKAVELLSEKVDKFTIEASYAKDNQDSEYENLCVLISSS